MTRKDKKVAPTLAFVLRFGLAIELLASTSGLAQVKWCDSGMDAFEEMRKAGLAVAFELNLDYGRNALLPHGVVPMFDDFAYVSNIVSEVGAPSFRKLLSAANGSRATETPEYGLFAVIRPQSIELRVTFKEDTATAEAVYWKLRHYASDRREGHSVAYATDSLKELQLGLSSERPGNDKEAPARRVLVDKEELAQRFRVPLKWLQQSTNDLSYFVVDGPVAWVYEGTSFRKRDARELDPAFLSKLDQVREEVRKTGRKAPHIYYTEIKKLLKERHDIEWLSPLDLNPGLQIDF